MSKQTIHERLESIESALSTGAIFQRCADVMNDCNGLKTYCEELETIVSALLMDGNESGYPDRMLYAPDLNEASKYKIKIEYSYGDCFVSISEQKEVIT